MIVHSLGRAAVLVVSVVAAMLAWERSASVLERGPARGRASEPRSARSSCSRCTGGGSRRRARWQGSSPVPQIEAEFDEAVRLLDEDAYEATLMAY